MRAVRTTWTAGGVGLVLCGVLGLMQSSFRGPAAAIAIDVLFAAALVLFAIGVSPRASVVARRPLGTVALLIVGLWPLVARAAEPFLPVMGQEGFDAGMEAYRAAADVLTTVFYVNLLVMLAAATVAVFQIARAGVVRGVWRWAPLWALLASLLAGVSTPLLLAGAGPAVGPGLIDAVNILATLGFLARTLGLGIIALVLAARLRTGDVDVLRSP